LPSRRCRPGAKCSILQKKSGRSNNRARLRAHLCGPDRPSSRGSVTTKIIRLRDPKNRSGAWWEPFKFIPLDPAGQTYLTLGDESRLRYEQYWNNNFGSTPVPVDPYLRFRDLPYADLHLGSDFRLFGQLMTAYGLRSPLTKNPETDETGVEVLQGFGDWRLPLGSDDSVRHQRL
jgi:hypothetical protein